MLFGRILIVLGLLMTPFALRADTFRIAASSSLQFALNEVIASYVEQSGKQAPQIVYGSSGNLYRQIVQGAPFELFFSARGELPRLLFERGISIDAGDLFGSGRLALISAKPINVDLGLAETIRSQVVAGNQKLAIANPAHAPYGRAAKEVLQSLGVWQEVQQNLVNAEQVSQATRFVASGAASFGLVSLSLALSPPIAEITHYELVDEGLHDSVSHKMVRLNAASADAVHFYRYVEGDGKAIEIFSRYGLR